MNPRMSTQRYRVLDGLPPYGAPALGFSATGQGTHCEGLVVELTPSNGSAWIGNFQRGASALDAVVALPAAHDLIVFAGGQAYVIDPETRACVRTFGGTIERVLALADHVVVSNGLWLEATDGEHTPWRTRRLSWDGMTSVRLDGGAIVGEAYDPMTDTWVPFSVDVATGEATGGSYPPELPP